ncbi:TolC family protein [Fulvivirga lutimaris]|uniref:TolC family protein n=1 Tax=Fulvivirga lutimaris TaxID=1819566 RepID=UPI0012BCD5BF|nr:TolC family protein [Fulvivirga lutimaris]MTI41624.1 TolC family protein [Fulvivirga lutimaris]
MIRQGLLLIIIWSLTIKSYAQDTLVIDKSALLQKVHEGNLQLKIASKQVEIAQGDLSQSRASYLPTITASHTAMVTNNPLMAFGSKLNQEILTQADFNPALLNDPDNTTNFATEIQILQPLLNLDYAYQRQGAIIQAEAQVLQAQRTSEYLELEVLKAYMQLQLSYEAVSVLRKAQKTAREGLRVINDYNDQGLVQKTDVLAVKVRVSEVESQLRFAESNVQNASAYLGFLFGTQDQGIIYRPSERSAASVEIETFDDQLSDSRKDVTAMSKAEEGYQAMLKSDKMSLIPRINAFGSYQLYDEALFGFGASGYIVGAQLSWNIFDGSRTIGKIQKSKAQFEKARFENNQYKGKEQMELDKTIRQLNDLQNKVRLTGQALEQSEEAYRIRKDRFAEGLEKTADLLAAETKYFQKELEYRQSIFEYNLTKEYLRFLTK